MATTIEKLTNGNVKITYPDAKVAILNPCANVLSFLMGYDDCIGIETAGGTIHRIAWNTVASPLGGESFTTKVGLAVILGTDFFYDNNQVVS